VLTLTPESVNKENCKLSQAAIRLFRNPITFVVVQVQQHPTRNAILSASIAGLVC
jgi:hypothetical protein